MRRLMERERPASGFWDLKLSPGGQVDAEFAAQFLQIASAPEGGPLRPGVLDALAAAGEAELANEADLAALAEAWRLQQALSQFIKAALDERSDVVDEPEAFKALLARAGGCSDFAELEARLGEVRAKARAAFEKTLA